VTATYIPLKELPNYLDTRLWDICSAAIGMDSQYSTGEVARETLNRISGWSRDSEGLQKYIEYHGLSGLLYSLNLQEDFNFTTDFNLHLKGAVVKHQQRWAAFASILTRLIENLGSANTPFIVLKGAALASDIYARPYQRAMADIDILVSPEAAVQVRDICFDLGFNRPKESAPDSSDLNFRHHHLPAIYAREGQHTVMLEIHTQALSPDIEVDMSLDDTIALSRRRSLNTNEFRVFDHTNMLRHLCLHTFSRDQLIKLSGVVDIFRYSLKYENDIDWTYLQNNHFHVINTLRCCRQLLSLPDNILPAAPKPSKKIEGAGLGILPLREYSNRSLPLSARFRQILFPSKWWQHVFYAVAPEQSLLSTRYFRHPLRILKWFVSKYRQL
jgi:hypothetical protein